MRKIKKIYILFLNDQMVENFQNGLLINRMEINNFSLSFTNVKQLPFEKYEKNFSFIVNNKVYETSRYIADILSPIIREYHYIDETIDKFSIQINSNEKGTDQSSKEGIDYFADFLKLAEYKSKPINESQRKFYTEYFIQLGNIDEYLRLQPDYFEDLNPENLIDRLKFNIENVRNIKNIKMQNKEIQQKICDLVNSSGVKKMIEYASSHFTDLPIEKVKTLSIEIIEEIIKDEALELEDEDALLNIITELYEEDEKYSILFEYVKFENVSEECLSKFIEAFNIENLNLSIWKSICPRLLPSKEWKMMMKKGRYMPTMKRKNDHIEFKFEIGHEFEGILKYLTNETGGNIHDNGTIEITSNSIWNNWSSDHPKNLVDYQNDNYYSSSNDADIFVCFDFKNRRIQLSGYSVKSHENGQNRGHLRNWVIEVSKDGQLWEEVDRHSNDSTLNGSSITATFNVASEQSDFYRYVRLRQTGYSWNLYPTFNVYTIYFCLIEFFGKVVEIPQ